MMATRLRGGLTIHPMHRILLALGYSEVLILSGQNRPYLTLTIDFFNARS
jgi:hypothetical protein